MENIPWWKTLYAENEIDRINRAIKNLNISQGKVTEEFENRVCEILNVPYAVATPNCSVGMVLALMTLGIEPGDEVIVPDRTFIATAHAALLLGAKVVLAETMQDTPVLDTSKIEGLITHKTKAIMPVHLNGRFVDMISLQLIAKKHGVYLVEDAAQAFYSKSPLGFAGTLSDIGCFSFGMTKLISTGQGGMCVTRNKDIYERMKLVRNHGVELGKTHESEFHIKSCNFKFTDILAAGGLAQLERLEQKVAHVNAIYRKYAEGLKGLDFIKLIPVNVDHGEVALWAEVLATDREKMIKYLAANGIATDRFLPDLHHSSHLGVQKNINKATIFDSDGFIIPCGPDMPISSVEIVISTIKNYQ